MSDEEMEKLPQRSMTRVGAMTAIRTVVSGLVTDLGPRIGRLRARLRGTGNDEGGGGRRGGARAGVGQEREEARLAGMSEEDRAWEDASLQRDRERRARDGDRTER
ncbi:MAG: hypothetical protein M3Q10_08950 [Chloroflexota bacterium]|nr:hypothetical protein [Chloroflexota bacterium]